MKSFCNPFTIMDSQERGGSGSSGLTLVEVIIAMVLFSMLSLGLLQGTLQTRKFTEENIYHQAAQTAIIGYLEQIKSQPYIYLRHSLADPLNVPLRTVIDHETPDPLRVGYWNYKNVTINTDSSGNPIETMDLWVLPLIDDLTAVGDRPAFAIQMRYYWRSPATRQLRGATKRIVRSTVETY